MELERAVGLSPDGAVWLPERRTAVRSILLKLAAMGVHVPVDTGDRGRAPPRRRSLRPLPRADPAALRAPVPRRPADPALHRRAAVGRGASRARPAARRDPHPRSLRPRPRAVASRSTRTRGTTSWCRAIGSTTVCCTTRSTIAAPPRACFTSPRAASRSPRTRPGCRSSTYLRLLQEALRPPPDAHAPAVHRELAGAGRDDGLPAASAAGVSRGPQGVAGEAHGGPILRSRRAGVEPGLRREHLRQRRRSLPARQRRRARRGRLDRPQRLRHPGAPSHAAAQEGPRSAAREPGHRRASAPRACAGRTRASCTTTAARSRSPRAAWRA